jgi:hypothetical protein
MRRPVLLALAALAVAGVLLLVYLRVSAADCLPRVPQGPGDRSVTTCR